MLQIFSYLPAKDLLAASAISRRWRERTSDEKLWRTLFAREGWLTDTLKMRAFEEAEKEKRDRAAGSTTSSRVRKSEYQLERRGSKRQRPTSGRVPGWIEQHGAVEADPGSGSEDSMEGIETIAPGESWSFANAEDEDANSDTSDAAASTPSSPADANSAQIKPKLFTPFASDPKLSWSYLYKQRRRLERNWDKGQYKMFQIPHPEHPEEGHEECVYTIQHSGKNLVSGSRDKTIRIWDLETMRLVRKLPLPHETRGHTQSVLCLQFDPRPDHDIIVTGGSDSLVIIWQFSTGELLKCMSTAHLESVLNLRFDDRYIVTCSKDKTIKVWNRREVMPDDPILPNTFVLGLEDMSHASPIKEYTLLATMIGHQAAVNAVQIHEDKIVSASGDRTIKAWDILTGELAVSYNGHTKGIACVQFDGRRVVSGSSDNTVRIFDAVKGAEVACMTGHTNLVRTVQARFGDLQEPIEDLEAEARAADAGLFKAMQNGLRTDGRVSRAPRNAGSSRPQDMLACGTIVPPGGGGSRWARIVSGSYDETVIIWKKDSDGNWQVSSRLYQDMLLRGAGHRRRVHATQVPQPPNVHAIVQQTPTLPANVLPTQLNASAVNQVNQLLLQPNGNHPPNLQAQLLAAHQHMAQQAQTPQNIALAAQTHTHLMNAGAPVNNAAQAQPPAAPHAHQQPPAQQNAAHQQAAAVHAAHVPAHRDSNRVFKLQFDARRIICCSQNKIIVGWDFANGDNELQRVSELFVETA